MYVYYDLNVDKTLNRSINIYAHSATQQQKKTKTKNEFL